MTLYTKTYRLIEPFASDFQRSLNKPFIYFCPGISSNPNAISFLQENPNYINWSMLSRNSNAVSILYNNISKIHWHELSCNTSNDEKLLELFLSVNKDNLCWTGLSSNPSNNAVTMLYSNPEKIDYNSLALNKNAAIVPLLRRYIVETTSTNQDFSIFWRHISKNESIGVMFPDYIEYLFWDELSRNSSNEALNLIEMNMDKINWMLLNYNTNARAIKLLETHIEYIDWNILSENNSDDAVALLEKNQDKICWTRLSCNTNPRAIELLKNNIELIHWEFLSSNPSAISILVNNLHLIDYVALSFNPEVFILEEN
jgi:hypothetical protein